MKNNELVFDDAKRKTLQYFKGDELATNVFLTKYALHDLDGNILESSPEEMHARLAGEFARIEKKYKNPMSEEEIYELFDNFKFVIPQGSPMSGVGNNHQIQSLSNCFVIDSPEDSYGGILFADQEQVQIMKRRGGVGFDISKIRPKGLATSNAAKTTDGISIFMERFSNSCREVAQGGRRGALMLTMDCRHPEVETFINIKKDKRKVTGANISIKFTDEFMQAVKNNENFTLRWPVNSSIGNASITKIVSAKMVWEKFVDSAHACAEPGALFWDQVQRESPADCYSDLGYTTVSTNPCAEIPLSSYDSCRLMVINLYSFVEHPFTHSSKFNYQQFSLICMKAQRLMDDLIDLEEENIDKIILKIKNDPENEEIKKIEIDLWNKIKKATLNGRRTGLGITGLGDTLAALGSRYGDDNSIHTTEKIYKVLALSAYESSVNLAIERGSFPIYDPKKEEAHPYLTRVFENQPQPIQEKWKTYGRRNIALLTTAPVGSVSCLTQTTSGIEPAYLLKYTRRRKLTQNDPQELYDFIDDLGDKWKEFNVYHHGVKDWMKITGNNSITDECPYRKSTSADIDWKKSVEIQASAQKWVDHGISKTCNLPATIDKNTVSQVYMKAWEYGCKGFTVYRDGSRSGVLISDNQPKTKPTNKICNNHAPKRPDVLPCEIHQVSVKGEKWTILVGILGGKPYEILGGSAQFVEIPKKYCRGSIKKRERKTVASKYDLVFGDPGEEFILKDVVSIFNNANYGSFTRTISLSLRHGVPINFLVEQLQKDPNADLFCFSRVISRVLKKYIEDGTVPGGVNTCPECKVESSIIYQEGCMTCKSCGWGKCG